MVSNQIDPSEVEEEKRRLINKIKTELKIHGLVDITAFIEEHTQIHRDHTHSGFVRSVAYKLEKEGIAIVIPVEDWKRFYVKELTWAQRRPFLHALRINGVNFILSLIVGLTIGLVLPRYNHQSGSSELQTQIQQLHLVHDSLTTLRRDIQKYRDSLKHK